MAERKCSGIVGCRLELDGDRGWRLGRDHQDDEFVLVTIEFGERPIEGGLAALHRIHRYEDSLPTSWLGAPVRP